MKTPFQLIGEEITAECVKASGCYPPFNSAHEGLAVILEELEELKAEVFKNHSKRDLTAMHKEAIQVGAMALRFVNDVCNVEFPKR